MILVSNIFSQAAKRAGWLSLDDNIYPRVSHVGFGLVLGEDGKRFRTRSSEVVRLVDLLDEAKSRSKQVLIERGTTKCFCLLPLSVICMILFRYIQSLSKLLRGSLMN